LAARVAWLALVFILFFKNSSTKCPIFFLLVCFSVFSLTSSEASLRKRKLREVRRFSDASFGFSDVFEKFNLTHLIKSIRRVRHVEQDVAIFSPHFHGFHASLMARFTFLHGGRA